MTEDELRAAFEAQASPASAWGFKRSRRGHYVNPATARDWKWFRLGAAAERHPSADTPASVARKVAQAAALLHSLEDHFTVGRKQQRDDAP